MSSVRSVDDMISVLPKEEQAITKRLRALVTECLPFATEKPYYGAGIPFYSRYRQICYIMPSSAICEPGDASEMNRAKTVSLCFCQGNLMSNEDGVLKAEGRKQVYVMYLSSVRDVIDEQIRALLYEAAMIDESFNKKKKTKK